MNLITAEEAELQIERSETFLRFVKNALKNSTKIMESN